MHYQVNVAYDRALKQLLKLIAIFMSKNLKVISTRCWIFTFLIKYCVWLIRLFKIAEQIAKMS